MTDRPVVYLVAGVGGLLAQFAFTDQWARILLGLWAAGIFVWAVWKIVRQDF